MLKKSLFFLVLSMFILSLFACVYQIKDKIKLSFANHDHQDYVTQNFKAIQKVNGIKIKWTALDSHISFETANENEYLNATVIRPDKDCYSYIKAQWVLNKNEDEKIFKLFLPKKDASQPENPTENVLISFDFKGGLFNSSSDILEIKIKKGTKLEKSQIPAPTKDGFKFLHFVDQNNVAFDFENTNISENITLYATYEQIQTPTEKFLVEFDFDGGTFNGENKKIIEVKKGEKISAADIPVPTKDGFKFEYFTRPDGSKFKASQSITENLKLTAHYKEIQTPPAPPPGNFNVIFDLNGGKFNNLEQVVVVVKNGEKIKDADIPAPVKENHTFKYFIIKGKNKQFDKNEPITAELKLLAIYEKNPDPNAQTWDVEFDFDGGTFKGDSSLLLKIENNKRVKKAQQPHPEKTNHKFLHFIDVENNQIFNFNVNIKKNYKLKAIYEPINNNVIVNFDLLDGAYNGLNKIKVEVLKGNKLELSQIPVPVKIGYDFLHFKKADGSIFSNDEIINENLNLTAFYVKKITPPSDPDKIIIIFDFDKGLFNGKETLELEIEKDTQIAESNIPTPTKSGYEFLHFEYSNGQVYSKDDTLSTNQTLIAIYKKIQTGPVLDENESEFIFISFDFNNGTYNGERSLNLKIKKGKKIGQSQIPAPELTNHTFLYFINQEHIKFDFNGTIDHNLSLIAVYKSNENNANLNVTINFDFDGGYYIGAQTLTIKHKSGRVLDISKIPKPYKKGYKLSGWRNETTNRDLNFDKFKFNSKKNKVLITEYQVKVKWETDNTQAPIAEKVYVSFNFNGGSYQNQDSYVIDLNKGNFIASNDMPKPYKNNKRFSHYNLKNGSRFVDETIINFNIELTAVYEDLPASTNFYKVSLGNDLEVLGSYDLNRVAEGTSIKIKVLNSNIKKVKSLLINTVESKNIIVVENNFSFFTITVNDNTNIEVVLEQGQSGPSLLRPDGSNYPAHFGQFPAIPNNYYDNINFDNDSAETIINKISEWENKYTRFTYNDAGKGEKMAEADISEEDPAKAYGIYNAQLFPKEWTGKPGVENYNREHVWCNSKLGVPRVPGNAKNQASDLHNLRVAQVNLNSTRNNFDFGSDGTDNAKIGYLHTTSGNQQFFPGKEHKGDVARILLYMACKWRKQNLKLVIYKDPREGDNYNPNRAFIGDIRALKKWNREDPVSNFEVHRNEVIFNYQKDRNVFIDHPEWFDKIIDFLVDEAGTTSFSLKVSSNLLKGFVNYLNIITIDPKKI